MDAEQKIQYVSGMVNTGYVIKALTIERNPNKDKQSAKFGEKLLD